MKIDEIFRDYDIRGKVPGQLTAELAYQVGQALAEILTPGAVAVGRDMRPDSNMLADNLMKGLIARGREVWDLNLITSDMLYFAVGKFNLAGGAMITASHNNKGYNGIKLCGKDATPVAATSGLAEIKHLVQPDITNLKPKKLGKVIQKQITADWIKQVLSFADTNTWPKLPIAVDAGNGMAGLVMGEFAKAVPLEVEPLWWELDGDFPNRKSDPTNPANLKGLNTLIKKTKPRLGLAFDGDGDRIMFVDETGTIVSPHLIAAILATNTLAKFPKATIVIDVRTSRLVEDVVKNHGGKVVRAAVGMPHIEAAMRQHNAPFGAEVSAHYYFKNNWFAYSGLIAAVVVMDVLWASGQQLSDFAQQYQNYYQSGELNFTVADKQAGLDKLKEHFKDGQAERVDGLSVHYPDWWFNVRPSNTEALLRLNVEANAQELLDQKTLELKKLIA